ncbi:MAG: MlaD family protein [Wenzhouxiangella sp.]|jgi:phospholipid/cholesterol/gamma-HCH transport system substrate-binding protein|nr:MlaD family protein [Wenzhouxiangella sp.]
METQANHVLIGAVTVLGALLAVALGLWSASYRIDEAWQSFEIHFSQAVTGLAVGSVVQYNGINMGNVRDLYLDPEDPSRVIAVVRVDAQAPVREDTSARLTVNGLTGVSFIQLRGGSASASPLRGESGRLPVIVAEESPLQRLIDQSEDIASTASEVMLRLLDFLSEENASRVSGTLDNIDAFTVAMAAETDRVGAIMSDLSAGASRLEPLLAEFSALMGDVRGLVAGLEGQIDELAPELAADLQTSLERFASVAERVDRMLAANEQAINEFGNETLVELGPTIAELRRLIRDLSVVGSRFERNPARFLLGTERPEEYQPE